MKNFMMDRARLGTVPGVALAWVRMTGEGPDHRGNFWFRADQNEEMQRLLAAAQPVELVGWVAGKWMSVTTRLVSAHPHAGLAVFEGRGEPALVQDRRQDVAG